MEEPRYLIVFDGHQLKTYPEVVEHLQYMLDSQYGRLIGTLDSPIVFKECIRKILSTVTIIVVDDSDVLDYSNFMSDISLEKLRDKITDDEESYKQLKEELDRAEYLRLKEKYERT